MKMNKAIHLAMGLLCILALTACSNDTLKSDPQKQNTQLSLETTENSTSKSSPQALTQTHLVPSSEPSSGQIYLYGEAHGVEKILAKEFELWNDLYQNKSMRHLFVELPYYTAEYLNLWMQSDSDEIMDGIYNDWAGTACYNPDVKAFYEKIKSQCPETVFHGTDVGHQYDTTGARFLKHLKSNALENSEQYVLTQEAIQQGKFFYDHSDDVYRENKMAENFQRAFDQLKDQDVMGIYGAAHTGLKAMDFTGSVPCMANQLNAVYADQITSEDLSALAKDIEPLRVESIEVEGKAYQASYFGTQDISMIKGYLSREIWRIEDAYIDFKYKKLVDNCLPYDNYPMLIESGEVFIVDCMKTDGSLVRKYYRSDGNVWSGKLVTDEFKVND